MSPTLYLIAAILFVGGKLNNFNIKNHPLDIRVRRDVRTPIHDYAGRVSEELDTRGKLSAILDHERLRQQRDTIGVKNKPEETSDISKEKLDTNRNLSSDLNGEDIYFKSANSEESDNIAGVEESNTNENLSSDHGDPEGRFRNVNPEEFSDTVDDEEGETAVEDATLAPIKEDGSKLEKYVVNRPKDVHRNVEETTISSTRRKRDLGSRANGAIAQYGSNTNKATVPNTETNIMKLYARLPYQQLAYTTTNTRIGHSLASNLVNNYKSNSPFYDNSAENAPTYTAGYHPPPPSTTTENTTPLILESCILCVSNGCPSFFRKIGFLCMPIKRKV